MHMPIDEPGRDDTAAHIVRLACVAEPPARMDAGDHRADDADIGLAQLQRRDIDDPPAGQQQIERLLALRRRDGAQPRCKIDRLVHVQRALLRLDVRGLAITENLVSCARWLQTQPALPTRQTVSASLAARHLLRAATA